MLQRSLLVFFVLLAIVLANLLHFLARWFVDTQGILPGLLLVGVIVLVAQVLDPYWED
jgi:hypothetical protein